MVSRIRMFLANLKSFLGLRVHTNAEIADTRHPRTTLILIGMQAFEKSGGGIPQTFDVRPETLDERSRLKEDVSGERCEWGEIITYINEKGGSMEIERDTGEIGGPRIKMHVHVQNDQCLTFNFEPAGTTSDFSPFAFMCKRQPSRTNQQ